MNNKSTIILLGVILFTAIAVLEVSNLHPHLAIDRFSISWSGIRHMGFASYNAVLTDHGKQRPFSQYHYGPVLIMIKP